MYKMWYGKCFLSNFGGNNCTCTHTHVSYKVKSLRRPKQAKYFVNFLGIVRYLMFTLFNIFIVLSCSLKHQKNIQALTMQSPLLLLFVLNASTWRVKSFILINYFENFNYDKI